MAAACRYVLQCSEANPLPKCPFTRKPVYPPFPVNAMTVANQLHNSTDMNALHDLALRMGYFEIDATEKK